MNKELEEMKMPHILKEKTANNLKTQVVNIRQFKMFPKIHKGGNLGRTVGNAVKCLKNKHEVVSN